MRSLMLVLLAVVYFAFGVFHVVDPAAFLAIMPPLIPFPRDVVIFTGLCEIAGAGGLLFARTRWLAGVMLALYAICVFPANVYHALAHVHVPPLPDSWWYHAPRLAAQPVIVWWSLYCARVIDWPFARAASITGGVGVKRA
jgi:uncharacterized membrane protein